MKWDVGMGSHEMIFILVPPVFFRANARCFVVRVQKRDQKCKFIGCSNLFSHRKLLL